MTLNHLIGLILTTVRWTLDSAYIAFSSTDWKSLLKSSFKADYEKSMAKTHSLGSQYKPGSLFHWFPRDCCAEHKAFDKRTPGFFKLECDGIVGLYSKTYFC
jgi:hypothetical protein